MKNSYQNRGLIEIFCQMRIKVRNSLQYRLWSNNSVSSELLAAALRYRRVEREDKGNTRSFSISLRQFSLCLRTDNLLVGNWGDRSCKIDIINDIAMNNKTPPSEMIRVPTVLIPIVRQLAKIHRDGHTTALLQGLQELIAQFDSSVKLEATSELQQVEEKLLELETHLCQQDQQVATKLEVLGKQLENIEKAIASGKYGGGNSKPRRSGYTYQYQQQAVEIKEFAPENLAQRLGVTQQSLITERESKSEQEFISWSRNRDPSSLGWKFQISDGLYYPVRQ